MDQIIKKLEVLKNSLEACEHNAKMGPHPNPKIQVWGEQMLKQRFSKDVDEILKLAKEQWTSTNSTITIQMEPNSSSASLSSSESSSASASSQAG